MLVIILLGLSTLESFVSLLAVSTPRTQSRNLVGERKPPSGPIENWLRNWLADGYWTFDGTDWEIAFRREANFPNDELPRRLSDARREDKAEAQSDRDLLDALKPIMLLHRRHVDWLEYRLSGVPFVARLFTHESSTREQILLGQVGWQEGAQWNVLEFVPATASSRSVAANARPLLPLPESSVVLARRWRAQGELMAEVVWSAPMLDTLQTRCRLDGWEVNVREDVMLCTRKKVTLAVRSFGNDLDRTVLLITRVPNETNETKDRP